MRAIVFAGPSLRPSAVALARGFDWRPPVRQGDVYKAALGRPALIGIVDGYFEVVPTVWHKEILWAMAQGIHVYGAASIGALRAAELGAFGMCGVGKIFEDFRDGVLQDDDEVAVLHGPAELDYIPLTDAMVNVRATLDKALNAGILDLDRHATLLRTAKSLFYKERTFDAIVRMAAEAGTMGDVLGLFTKWLENGRVDQKRDDALAMLDAMRSRLDDGVARFEASFSFAHTFVWEEARRRADGELEPR